MFQAGQNGQWVRTRTEADAKAFIQEKRADQERSLHTGTGTLIVTGAVLLFLVGWALYGMLR
ncbi:MULTISPECIES: hypothetical protein [Streptomyces]|uniref:hypothetical protein n=1 Tax=Streptomyces TaxID=1883 RepID=UPI00210A363B|nr:hypothetical protein [Streptomyces longispororuber]MCQ4207456.1 hypothetical protein [Streptomyces longispororuber]